MFQLYGILKCLLKPSKLDAPFSSDHVTLTTKDTVYIPFRMMRLTVTLRC